MKTRNDYLRAFLAKHHVKPSELVWLVGDASKRKYARIYTKNKTYILMDSPLDEKPKEFYQIDKILRSHHLPAPRIFAKDLKHGFLILEDFGSCPMSHVVKSAKNMDDLYILALDTLIRIQKSVTEHDKLPASYSKLLQETLLFTQYYVPKIAHIDLPETANQEFENIWRKLLHQIDLLPKTIMLYDYHIDNIMVKSDGSLGILDFQDAMLGTSFYDLISLIQDERHPIPPSKQKMLLDHYFELRPVLMDPKYKQWVDVVAAHRHTRVMGIFARLAAEYGHPEYLKYIPNDWMFLCENIKSPLLSDYKNWLKKYMSNYLKLSKSTHK